MIKFTIAFKVAKLVTFRILLIGTDNGLAILAETCNLILTERNAASAECDTRLFFKFNNETEICHIKVRIKSYLIFFSFFLSFFLFPRAC